MKHLYILALFISAAAFSQTENTLKNNADSIKRHHLIYAYEQEVTRTTVRSGRSTTSRTINFDFKVGVDGRLQNIGKKGKNLRPILQSDPEAYAELEKAYDVHLRKKRAANALEYVGYGVAAASAIPLFAGIAFSSSDSESGGSTGLLIGGGAGVLAGLTMVHVFKKKTDQHMDAAAASIANAIAIYNNNLLEKNTTVPKTKK